MELRTLIREHMGEDRVAELVPGRILAVDDEGGNLVVLDALLSDVYDVTCTTSPHEAREMIRQREFDAVLADQRMPDITGVELLREVRSLYPNTVRIIISAYSDSKAMLQAINVGEVFRFIMKPWEPEEVLAIVRQGLEYRLSILAIRRLAEELHVKNARLVSALDELRMTQDKLLQSARLATVGQLTSSIVRELRNHVTGVKVLSEMLEQAELPGDLAEYARVGAQSAQALFDLVSGISSFASGGTWRLKRARWPLNVLVQDGVRIARMDSRSYRVSLSFEPDQEVGAALLDGEKVRQVVVALVLNALDATPAGGSIRVTSFRPGPGRVGFAVEDTGCGMDAQLLERAGDPFVSTREEGLGLGLAVCRRVVQAHDGTIEIISRRGEGTIATVSMPVESGMPGEVEEHEEP